MTTTHDQAHDAQPQGGQPEALWWRCERCGIRTLNRGGCPLCHGSLIPIE